MILLIDILPMVRLLLKRGHAAWWEALQISQENMKVYYTDFMREGITKKAEKNNFWIGDYRLYSHTQNISIILEI